MNLRLKGNGLRSDLGLACLPHLRGATCEGRPRLYPLIREIGRSGPRCRGRQEAETAVFVRRCKNRFEAHGDQRCVRNNRHPHTYESTVLARIRSDHRAQGHAMDLIGEVTSCRKSCKPQMQVGARNIYDGAYITTADLDRNALAINTSPPNLSDWMEGDRQRP